MGNEQGKPDFKELSKGTNFTSKELSAFFDKFKKDFPDGQITRDQFIVLHKKMIGVDGDATEFCDLTFKKYDKDNSGTIDFKEFITTLNVASRGTADEKLLWAFHMYDKDGDGYLTESEIKEVLTVCNKSRHEFLCGSSPNNQIISNEAMHFCVNLFRPLGEDWVIFSAKL